MRTLVFWCLISLTGFLLLGCAPEYKTQYFFIPPDSPEGKACIFQCENSRLQCGQIADMKSDQCKAKQEQDCERNKRYSYNQYTQRNECVANCYCATFQSECAPNYSQCADYYRSCYSACGGKITSKTVCVSFCDSTKSHP